MDIDVDAFWAPLTAGQVAARQGITRPQPLDRLIGAAPDLWDSDEEFDQFLGSTDRTRRGHTSA